MSGNTYGMVLNLRYYLGVQPPASLSKYYWSTVFLFVNVLCTTIFITGKKKFDYDNGIGETIDNFVVTLLMLMVPLVVFCDYKNRKEFKALLKSLEVTDRILLSLDSPAKDNFVQNYFSFYVFGFTSLFFTVYEIHYGGLHWRVVLDCLCGHYYEVVSTTSCLVTVCLVRTIAAQLEAATNLLQGNDIILAEKAVFVHERIWLCGQKLNDLQGWNNFGFVTYNFIEAVTSCYFFLSPQLNAQEQNVRLLWVFYRVFHVLQLSVTCSWASHQCDEFNNHLYGRVIQDEAVYHDENIFLECYVLMKRNLQFDAKGFFSLTCGMFLLVMSAMATNIVLLVQAGKLC